MSHKAETMDTPCVVVKGVGFLALKIKELAREHNVPTVENRPLAQTLYKTVEVGDTIPANGCRPAHRVVRKMTSANPDSSAPMQTIAANTLDDHGASSDINQSNPA